MSGTDASVRGSIDPELSESAKFQLLVAQALYASDPLALRAAFGVHDVREALADTTKDTLFALARDLGLSDVDPQAKKGAIAKLIRMRGLQLGALVCKVDHADDALVFAATVPDAADGGEVEGGSVSAPLSLPTVGSPPTVESPPPTPARPFKSPASVAEGPAVEGSRAAAEGDSLEALRLAGEMAAASLPPLLPRQDEVVKNAGNFPLGESRSENLAALLKLQQALGLPPCLCTRSPGGYPLSIVHGYLATGGHLRDPALMVVVQRVQLDPVAAEDLRASVWDDFFARPAGRAAQAHADALDHAAAMAFVGAAKASGDNYRTSSWMRIVEDGLASPGSMVSPRLADLLRAETLDNAQADADAQLALLRTFAIDYDSTVPLDTVVGRIGSEFDAAKVLCDRAEIPFTENLVETLDAAFSRSRAVSKGAKERQEYVRTHWILLRGTFAPDEIVDELKRRLAKLGVKRALPTVPPPRRPIPGTVPPPPVVTVHAAAPSAFGLPVPGASSDSQVSTLKRSPICRGCGREGHVLRDCPSTPRVPGTDGTLLQSMLCYRCRANGHKASLCPTKALNAGSAKNDFRSAMQPSSTAPESSA